MDPLDGTREFLNKTGEFTVNIALSYKGRAEIGVVYWPEAQKLYYASRGQGACLEDRKNKTERELHVSQRKEELVALLSRSHEMGREAALYEDVSPVIQEVRKVGSSLKGCLIAEGTGDVFYRFTPIWQWDTAAMQCIVEEAGGIMEHLDGSQIIYNREAVRLPQGFYILNSRVNHWL